MTSQILRWALALCAACLGGTAPAQQPSPPQVPLWTLEADGDAIQNGLGFILPPRWKDFERKGFTSTREDGASVMTFYETPDGTMRMRILLQLRGDVRGATLPGADAIERNWSFVESVGGNEYRSRAQGEPEMLADQRLIWGRGTQPNARMRLLRYDLGETHAIHGLWYRNIGLWAVVVTVSGPDDRRAEIERTGASVMTEMPWPGAPLNAELRAIGPEFLRNVKNCGQVDRGGQGRLVKVDPVVAMVMGTALTMNFLDNRPPMPHPALDPQTYCRLETFRVQNQDMVALMWQGDPSASWQARWAFMLSHGGPFFQVESMLSPTELAENYTRLGISRPVQLTVSNDRMVAALHTFTDWPSYDEAKALVLASAVRGPPSIVEVANPPGRMDVRVNSPILAELPAPPAR